MSSAVPKATSTLLAATVEDINAVEASRRIPDAPQPFPGRSPAVRQRGLRRLDRGEWLRRESTVKGQVHRSSRFLFFPCAWPCLLLRSLLPLPLAPPISRNSSFPSLLRTKSPLCAPSPSHTRSRHTTLRSSVCSREGGWSGAAGAGFVARGGFRALGASY